MHSFNHRRCSACGELAIKTSQRFLGGWFFIRCPNCRRQLRVDPQHGQRWVLLAAFVVIGAAAISGAALTGDTLAFVGGGASACALLMSGNSCSRGERRWNRSRPWKRANIAATGS